MIEKINKYFVTMFGLGKFKKIPGTIASFTTTVILFLYFHIFNFPKNFFLFFLVIVTIYAFIAVTNYIKSKKNKDPKEIVIDEFIGQSIPICLYEVAHGMPKDSDQVLKFYFIMFVLFRIFDIIKPFPVNYYEKNFKNSFGVIMDDVCAGLYVVAVLVMYMVFTS